MRSGMCAVLMLVVGAAFADESAKPVARAIDLKDVRVVAQSDGGKPKPSEIKSAKELADSLLFADATGRDAIKKQVDFEKEKIVVFAWSGSGQDKLTAAMSKDGKTAEFTLKTGLTDDLRRHALVFAVPKDAKVEVKE
ncbi:hypothetical protein VT84_38715 [Gemmata sp. SH-PL17]|uniref:hypothetical protein n=1 Tax=Gemmata sp. SH-PL17 TaxID=1630693 RepID=UPI0004B8763F|nr:hypothetical protein [Gemmata sp. SH-PL17]AMV30390.1 hypothetical protein VT84_38715 [Gemmata sp. SH-PL17]